MRLKGSLICLAIILAASVAFSQKVIPHKIFGDPAIPIVCTAGEPFAIELSSNPTTGYHWSVQTAPDPNVAKYQTSDYVASQTGLLGSGGKEYLIFESTGVGKTTVTLKYARDFEKDPNPTTKTFRIFVLPREVYTDPSVPITSAEGGSFAIRLDSNPTTGYHWSLAEPLGAGVNLDYSVYVPSQPQMMGSGGYEYWVFKAESVGKSNVKMKYARDFEKETAPTIKNFTVFVLPTKAYTDPAIPIVEQIGKSFVVVLPSNPTTGYMWSLAKPLGSKILKSSSNVYIPSKPILSGSGGHELWIFEIVGEGRTELSMKYSRSFESTGSIANTANFKVFALPGDVYTDPSVPIECKVGASFAIELNSNPTTGYSWSLAKPLDAKNVEEDYSVYSPSGTMMIGAGGKEYWVFTAVGPNEAVISLEYSRSFDKETVTPLIENFILNPEK